MENNVFDKECALQVSDYLNKFKLEHKSSISDFNKVCFEVVSRVLWRYAKYGFYKENQSK